MTCISPAPWPTWRALVDVVEGGDRSRDADPRLGGCHDLCLRAELEQHANGMFRPRAPERGEPHGTGLGIFRYVVEGTIAWLHGFRRLRIRWERRDDFHEAFLGLAVCLITHRHVQRLC